MKLSSLEPEGLHLQDKAVCGFVLAVMNAGGHGTHSALSCRSKAAMTLQAVMSKVLSREC